MSIDGDIKELWSQLTREDLRGIIAVTNGPKEHDRDVTSQVENALSEIKSLRWMMEAYEKLGFKQPTTQPDHTMKDKLIALLERAESWAHFYRGTDNEQNRAATTEHIEELKSAIKLLKESDLASCCEEADTDKVSERHERENDHLIHALHDVRLELVRTTEGIRSLSLVLGKIDLGNVKEIEMKVSELTGTVTEVKTTTLKVLAEVRARIDLADARILTLEGQLADADVPEAATTALAELKTIVGQLDDITPDAPDLPPVTPPVVTVP